MKRLALAVVLLGSGLYGAGYAAEGVAPSNESGKMDVNAAFSAFGFSEKRVVSQKSCRVTADIKQEEFIKSVPLLQKLELLNSEMSQATVRSKPTKIALAFAVQMAPIEIKNLFDDEKNIEQCRFIQNITFIDEYGNDKTIPMFTYDFDRTTHGKINWDKFQSTNVIKVSRNFTFTPELAAKTSEEAD